MVSLVPRPIPSFTMLHAEKHEDIEKLGIGLSTRLNNSLVKTSFTIRQSVAIQSLWINYSYIYNAR